MKTFIIALLLTSLSSLAQAKEVTQEMEGPLQPGEIRPMQTINQLPDEKTNNWKKVVSISPMDDTKTVSLHLSPKKGDGSLILRCKENVTAAFFSVSISRSYEPSSLRPILRFDKEKPQKIRMDESESGKALFHRNPITFIRKLLKNNTLVFRHTSAFNKTVTEVYDLSDLDAEIVELQETCNWK